MKLKLLILTYFLTGFLTGNVISQVSTGKVINTKASYADTVINTNDKFLIQNTENLKLNNIKLNSLEDYSINYKTGLIILYKSLFFKYSLDTNRIYDLVIEYDLFPYNIKEEYSNFNVITERDTLTGDTIQIVSQRKDFIENIFEGTDLEKSGSLFRGFTFGSNRDVSLNSGFRLQMNGKLSKDIEIVAALTDENTPIQPEGNTTKLQELDKVFIELRASNITATIGDIELNFPQSEFLNFKRKIQGARGLGDFNFGNFSITGAVSRGKFSTNRFNGSDGVQGPYRLIGANNETNILVLSGSEKVYIDGILMMRGEQADYIIDYNIGEITFTNKRVINNFTRIVVDFEYSDRKYSRTFLAASNRFNLLNKRLLLGFSYVNESDNPNSTIDFTLSDADKQILQNAGNDKNKAVKSGVVYVGLDSLGRGKGSYIKIDTTFTIGSYTFYRFNPGDSLAVYNISFSYVGQGRGDYIKQNSYQYNFIGINQGSYAPISFIPMPTGYQIANFMTEFAVDKKREIVFGFEGAYSYLDRNKLSTLDKSDNGGTAFTGNFLLNKNNFDLLGFKLKTLNITLKERIIGKLFSTLDRINSVEFNRDFDISDSLQAREELREASLYFVPNDYLKLTGNYANLGRGDFFNSTRLAGGIELSSFNVSEPVDLKKSTNYFKLKYSIENLSSRNDLAFNNGTWLKHIGYLSYKKYFGKDALTGTNIELLTDFNKETKKNSYTFNNADSLSFDSFAFDEINPRLYINNLYNFNIFAEFDYRNDDFANNGSLINLSKSYTHKYGFTYMGSGWFSSAFDFAIRQRNYSDAAILQGNQDNKTVLVNSRMRLEPFRSAIQTDLSYNVTSDRTAKIEKVFALVPVGQGNYIYLGDLNHNGIQDENEFQLVSQDGNYIKLNIPTDQFFPTVNVKTSARVYVKPSRYIFLNPVSFFTDLYNNVSFESIYRIDERSKDPNTDNLYYLRTSTFLNDSNTIIGTQYFQQDVNLFENNLNYSFRLRYIQQKGFNQYTSGNERFINIQRGARAKLGLTKDINTQLEYFFKTDVNRAPANSIRNRNIISNNFNSDISYKPIQQVESGIQFNFAKATDYYPFPNTIANINQQILRFIYSFTSVGRVRVEIERDEILLNTNPLSFPYELTSGHAQGKSYFVRAFLDYSISKNLQSSISYEGRSEGNRTFIHTGRAQVTAFF
jgi:hypothetical protein